MTITALEVYYGSRRVGNLTEPEPGRVRFTYAAAWCDATDGFRISASMPTRSDAYDTEASRFFGNLLPEGSLRTAICRRLGISEDNDFALLRALGRDCAGALAVIPAGEDPEREPAYRPFPREALDLHLVNAPAYALAAGGDVRLSLAGAQDKLPVCAGPDGLELPLHGAASTHLLKLPNRDYAALPENELLATRLAGAAGLPTAEVMPWLDAAEPCLLVKRYDRMLQDGGVRRLHQEDFCQALGLDRRRKYQEEGGPAFAQCVEVVRRHSRRPVPDTQALLRWLVCCVVLGNRDNHVKNLSLVRGRTGTWRLAPFYDLVTTAAYRRLSPRLALQIGGRRDAGNLPRRAWEREAQALDVSARYLLGLVEEQVARVAESLQPTHDAVAQELGTAARLQAPLRAIQKGIRALERSLRA